MSDQVITCRACGKRHGKRYMCDPLYEVLNVMMDAAEAKDMPVTEFLKGDLPPDRAGMLGEGTVMCRQIVVKAGVVPFSIGGQPVITQPCLVWTGEDADGKQLPMWTFPGSSVELRAIRDLTDRMTEMAIRRAEAGG